MTQPTLVQSSRKSGEDILVGLCGLLTSLATALILFLVERATGFAAYTWMVWFVIPVGAMAAGFAGASGYYFGARFFGHRPSQLLLVNILIASVATFLVLHYIFYVTSVVDGEHVSHYVSFARYLDFDIRSRSLTFNFRSTELAHTGKLGLFGYIVALLQIGGFALGGLAIYSHLVELPYCDNCSRYLDKKASIVRYSKDSDGLQKSAAIIRDHVNQSAVSKAMSELAAYGLPKEAKETHIKSSITIKRCETCDRHWMRYMVEQRSGNHWKEVPNLTVARFINRAATL